MRQLIHAQLPVLMEQYGLDLPEARRKGREPSVIR